MNPLVSILIPSRNRCETLKRTVWAFQSLASRLEQIEVIVRLHGDDEESLAWMREKPIAVRFIVDTAEGLGYESIGMFVNTLAACSCGDWLWPASDDMEILTPKWDLAFEGLDGKGIWLVNPVLNDHVGWRIPILSRGLYNAIGTCGETGHLDVYVDSLANRAGIVRKINLNLCHHGCAPPIKRDVPKTFGEFNSPANQSRMAMDLKKLKLAMQKP